VPQVWKSYVVNLGQANLYHYLIQDTKSAAKLGVVHIPHYMLIDAQRKMIDPDALAPDMPAVEAKIEAELKKRTH